MPNQPSLRTRVRVSIIFVGAAVGLAACGGSQPPAISNASSPATTAPSKPVAVGTSGMAGLDWGAKADAVLAIYPRGSADAGGIVYLGTVEGHQAIAHFAIGGTGLSKIEIEWTEGFVSMEDCGKGWHELREKLDGRFGPSQSDNLAAYWKLPAASVTLACNPNDSNAGVLSQTYEPRQPE